MDLAARCETEVRDLHAFFEGWFRGSRDDIDRLEAALAADFRMVTPAGKTRSRTDVVDAIESAHGVHADADPPFAITVDQVSARLDADDLRLVTYREHQRGPDPSSRQSSALLRASEDAPNGVEWVHLQETWLDG